MPYRKICNAKSKELVFVAIQTEEDKLRTEYSAEINSLKSKVANLEKSYAEEARDNGMSSAAAFEERKKRIVVGGIPCGRTETAQESQYKVMALVRTGASSLMSRSLRQKGNSQGAKNRDLLLLQLKLLSKSKN